MKISSVPRGFALPSAIFLLVVLAALGAFIANISTSQHMGMALDVQGERAYQAANAGMEWTRFKVAATSACPAGTAWGASAFSLGFAGTATLSNFHATIECKLLEATDVEGVATSVFEIRVTACNQFLATEPSCPGPAAANGYVERQMQGLVGI